MGQSSGTIENRETLDQVLQSEISSAQDAEASAQEQQADAAEDEIQATSVAIRARQEANRAIASANANASSTWAADRDLRTHLHYANAELRRAHEESARAAAALRTANATAQREAQELQQLRRTVAQDRRDRSAMEAQIRAAHTEGEQRLHEAQAQSQRAFDSQVGAVMGQDREHLREEEARLQQNISDTQASVAREQRRTDSLSQDELWLRWWLTVASAALGITAVAAACFYAVVVRMRRQRTYHMSVILRLNTERIKCVDRIKELSIPILEADAAEEAKLNGSTGCA